MKVITNKKHEDTIDLKDVDFTKHYVIGVTENKVYRYIKDYKLLCISLSGSTHYTQYDPDCCLTRVVAVNETLHAFNTLHEMLDFVKENTSE